MIYLLPLAWLWFTLINHLRVEWAVNPQYAYGWAVPFLCLYLIWTKVESRKQKAESGGGKAETLKAEMLKNPSAESPTPFSFSAFQLFSFSAFASCPSSTCQRAWSRKPIPSGDS